MGLFALFRPEKIWWYSCAAYRRQIPVLPRLLKAVNYFLFRAILPPEAEIQKDIRLGHFGLGVVVHPNVTIGRRVFIWHHVTLATDVPPGSPPRLRIGDDVVIGTGAVLLRKGDGDTVIGAGARVGANAVVTGDVAPGQTVVGVPARPTQSRRGSGEPKPCSPIAGNCQEPG